VGPFAAFGKFVGDVVIEARLGVQEANKVGISHGRAPFGSSIDAAEEPYARSGWTTLDDAMWVFRRLNYGFAQVENCSPSLAGCSASGMPGMCSIETSADPQTFA
jgi:hypothetical protein